MEYLGGMTTVLIADQQRMFSQALATALGQESDIVVLAERPVSQQQATGALATSKADVALIDCWLPAVPVIQEARRLSPATKIIVLSWIHRPEQVQEAISEGAVGFLPKTASLRRLIGAVQKAARGEALVYATELTRMVRKMGQRQAEAEAFAQRLDTLSAQELRIVVLLSQGHLIKEVCRFLGISEATVKSHINRILKKTQTRSHAEMLAMARTAGIIHS